MLGAAPPSALLEAARAGDDALALALVQSDVDAGVDVDLRGRRGETPLMLAAAGGSAEVARALVAAGADVNAADEEGTTVLMRAAERGSLELVRLLVDAGADVSAGDEDGTTALMRAAGSDSLEAARHLLARGADANAATSEGERALVLAAERGNLALARLLVDAGADVDAGDGDGKTALMAAAEAGEAGTVRLLLGAGASVAARGPDGWTPLMYAAMSSRAAVVEALVAAGADADAVDSSGWTPLLLAAMGGSSELARLLVAAGAHVDAAERDGWTPLMLAAERGSLELVQLLVDAGADVDAANREGRTAVFLAAARGHGAVQRLLIPLLRGEGPGAAACASDGSGARASLASRSATSWFVPPFEIALPAAGAEQGGGGGGGGGQQRRATWLDADVAIKLFIPAAAGATFAQELGVWHQLRHPNVIKLFGACDVGLHLFVCELATGGSLGDYAAARAGAGPAPWRLLLEAALGLAYLHERGVVHGDLRGSNILVGADGLAKLAGFSLSGSDGGGVFGSGLWQAPERLTGGRATLAADVYSLGLCVVEAVAGRLPWADASDGLVTYRKLSWFPAEDADSPFAPAPLPRELAELMACMCAQDPFHRATAAAVVPMIERLAHEEDAGRAHVPPEGEVLLDADAYKDGELLRLLDTVRLLTSQSDADGLRELVGDEVQAIYEHLAQSRRPHKLLDLYHVLLSECVSVLQPGWERRRIYSLSSTRAQGDNLAAVQHRMDVIWSLLEGSQFDGEARRRRWKEKRSRQLELFVSEVSQSLVVLDDLETEEDRAAFVALLQSEIDAHGADYTPGQLAVLRKALAAAASGAGTDALTSTPVWFIPWYELVVDDLRCLGEGGFGGVFRAKWLESDVVVKRLFFPRAATREARQATRRMFQREADIWFGLSHPHVVRLFGACHVGSPFFVCEYEPNGTLLEFVEAHPERLWRKLHEAALGVLYLHARGVVHGDLKCNNIVIGRDGRAKVTDFGLSAAAGQSDEAGAQVSGAWHWVAPECLAGAGARPTFASDVYSLGMCVVEALSRECPWRSVPNAAVKFNVTRLKKLPPRPADCTDAQWELVRKMCAHEPSERLAMTTVVDALARMAEGVDRPSGRVGDPPASPQRALAVVSEMKRRLRCDQQVDGADKWRSVLATFRLLWDRLDHLLLTFGGEDVGDLEGLHALVERAREKTLSLPEYSKTLVQFTEVTLGGYALHRDLDKLVDANFWRARVKEAAVHDWKAKCSEFLESQEDAIT